MNPILHFIWANVAYLATGKLRTKEGNTPRSGHKIPEDFACVGVASSHHEATDKAIIATLKYLKIQRVRLDFSYDDFSCENFTNVNSNRQTEVFLTKLIAANFKVHLHLIQPFEEAKKLSNISTQQAAADAWRAFVIKVCEKFGEKVTLIEVGSTINRKRWAGYHLNSFLLMWEIAFSEIKSRNIVLAGPNITDFEPLYNIGILAILKKRNQLPDIHTNNLFSERCTEPERDDHKILGQKFARFAGFRLIKKAYVLQNIGHYFGVNNLQSPSAFWTLPRIERLLPDSEQKQADYLTRYMVLCAASGAFTSAGWGPLICHREGLIDDGIAPYPELERITHYQNVSADVSAYRARPAFDAYKTFVAHIPGLTYQGKQNQQDFLEIHAFSNDLMQLHVVWTTNAKVASLNQIYTAEALENAVFIHRDGDMIKSNMAESGIVGESPCYIQFNTIHPVKLKQHAGVIQASTIQHCAIHFHATNTVFHHYSKNNWQGLIAAKDSAEFNLLANTLNPELIAGPNKPNTLRKARNAIWTIPDPRDANRKLVIKQPVKFNVFKKITDRFKPSKGLRSWNGAQELLRRGVNNAKPIAYFELINDNSLKQNFYICEYVPADFSVREMFSAFANGQSHFEGISQDDAYKQVCAFLLNMHNKGTFFRDLSGGNILVNKLDKSTLAFSLIDTGRARFFNHGTPLNMRLSDMARACNKLHADGRNVLMQIYMNTLSSSFGSSFGFWQKIPFITYNIKVAVKRQLKLKNIKKRLAILKTD